MKRILFVMIDGLGDLNSISISEDDNEKINSDFFSKIKTPTISEYFLDSLKGFFGLMDPVEPGIACGSDTAHLSIFGYDPLKFYSGRGAFETIGAGLLMHPGEIAFKCNFAFVDEITQKVLLRRVDKEFSRESKELCVYLQQEMNRNDKDDYWMRLEGITVTIQYATEHRCVVKIAKFGQLLSDQITGTDPLYDNLNLIKCKSLDQNDKNACLTAIIVQRVSDEIESLLLKHPINLDRKRNNKPLANVILFRGCSRAPNLPHFQGLNFDCKPLMIARTCIISGIGTELGFKLSHLDKDDHFVENEGTILEDMNSFINDLKKQPDCDFAFFHIKAVDEASHDCNFKLKRHLIEKIDLILNKTIERLIKGFESDEFRIVLTGDHSTLCRIGEHSCEPVPFIISEPLIEFRNLHLSTEASNLSKCYLNNNIGRFSGISVMDLLKNIIRQD